MATSTKNTRLALHKYLVASSRYYPGTRFNIEAAFKKPVEGRTKEILVAQVEKAIQRIEEKVIAK